jgi:hypothetical protein
MSTRVTGKYLVKDLNFKNSVKLKIGRDLQAFIVLILCWCLEMYILI